MKSFLTVLLAATLLGACASKKPKNDGSSSTPKNLPENVLELNGDSDSNKAGKIKTIHFAFNSSVLDSKAKDLLKSNTEYLKQNAPITIQIEGHCDDRGGRQYNLALGERRANAVKTYIKTLGVKPNRMKVISFGNERPVSFGEDEASRNQNRRANFVILSK